MAQTGKTTKKEEDAKKSSTTTMSTLGTLRRL
jgi:hypothetical protein